MTSGRVPSAGAPTLQDFHQAAALYHPSQIRRNQFNLSSGACHAGGDSPAGAWVRETDDGHVQAFCHVHDFPEGDRNIRQTFGFPEWAPPQHPLAWAGETASRYIYTNASTGESLTVVDVRHYDKPCWRAGCNRPVNKHIFKERVESFDHTSTAGFAIRPHPPMSTAPDTPAVVAEGQKTADAIAVAGFTCYSYLDGSSNAAKADYSALADAPLVLIAPDNDAAGWKAALHSALALLSLNTPAHEVRLIHRAVLPDKPASDLADVDQRRCREVLAGAASNYFSKWAERLNIWEVQLRLAVLDYESRSADGRPMLNAAASQLFDEVLAQAWKTLAARRADRNPIVFQRGGLPVYVGTQASGIAVVDHTRDSIKGDVAEAAFWFLGWHTGKTAPVLYQSEEPLTGAALQPVLDALHDAEVVLNGRVQFDEPATWTITSPKPHFPNAEVCSSMASILPSDMTLPELERVVACPVLNSQGKRLLTTAGFHQEAAIWLDAPQLHPLPAISECLARLWEVFGDFPFDSDSSYANLLATLVSLPIGPTVPKKPLFLFDKATPRTGATLMAEAVSEILTGREPQTLTQPHGSNSGEEYRKSITAAAHASRGVVLFDNFAGTINDGNLMAYLTAEYWEPRALGHNDRTIRISRHTILDIMTGNNLQLTDESGGRACISRLDAEVEHPGERTFDFDPVLRVRANRARYLEAVLGLVSHWLATGTPRRKGIPGYGGFEEWREIVGGILEQAGVPGFGEANQMDNLLRTDDGGERAFVAFWWETFGRKVVGVKDLALPEVIGSENEEGLLVMRSEKEAGRKRELGNRLRKMLLKTWTVEDGHSVKMDAAGTLNRAQQYLLRRTGEVLALGEPCEICGEQPEVPGARACDAHSAEWQTRFAAGELPGG